MTQPQIQPEDSQLTNYRRHGLLQLSLAPHHPQVIRGAKVDLTALLDHRKPNCWWLDRTEASNDASLPTIRIAAGSVGKGSLPRDLEARGGYFERGKVPVALYVKINPKSPQGWQAVTTPVYEEQEEQA